MIQHLIIVCYTSGEFPTIDVNSEIEYYIEVENDLGNIARHPIAGWHTFKLENIFGDINGDVSVNIQDIILLVNNILNNEYSQLQLDLNEDGELNVLDVVLLVNLILD